MDKIKGQLAGVAALLGVIAAIGGGFVKYGEITTKLKVLESKKKVVAALRGEDKENIGLGYIDPKEIGMTYTTGNKEYDNQLKNLNNKAINNEISRDNNYLVNDKIINKILNNDITNKSLKKNDSSYGTFNSFKLNFVSENRIDYVFEKNFKLIDSRHILVKTPSGRWASDHHPVLAKLKL